MAEVSNLGSGTPTAHSYYSSYYPSLACDGNTGNYWRTGSESFPHWWRYDYGAGNKYPAKKLRVYAYTSLSYWQNFKFQGSMDGSNWDDLADCEITTVSAWNDFEINSPICYRYHRLYKASGSSNYSYIREIDILRDDEEETVIPIYFYIPEPQYKIIFSERIDIQISLPMQGYFYPGDPVIPIIFTPPDQVYQYHLRALNRIVSSLEILLSLSIPLSIVGPVDPIDLTLQNDLTDIVTLEIGIKNTLQEKEEVLLSLGLRNYLIDSLSYADQYYFDKGHGLTA